MNDDLNVRQSLKNQFNMNGNGTGGGVPRKTLMHKMSENQNLNDSKEDVGFKYSQFNLKSTEHVLARLGRIHLILEHLIMIKMNLNLENGNAFVVNKHKLFVSMFKSFVLISFIRFFYSLYNILGRSAETIGAIQRSQGNDYRFSRNISDESKNFVQNR